MELRHPLKAQIETKLEYYYKKYHGDLKGWTTSRPSRRQPYFLRHLYNLCCPNAG